jgi:hypothetical protein
VGAFDQLGHALLHASGWAERYHRLRGRARGDEFDNFLAGFGRAHPSPFQPPSDWRPSPSTLQAYRKVRLWADPEDTGSIVAKTGRAGGWYDGQRPPMGG